MAAGAPSSLHEQFSFIPILHIYIKAHAAYFEPHIELNTTHPGNIYNLPEIALRILYSKCDRVGRSVRVSVILWKLQNEQIQSYWGVCVWSFELKRLWLKYKQINDDKGQL